MIYTISQFIGFAAFFVSILAYHKNKKEKILKNMIMSNVLNLIHYLLLGAYSGCITKFLAVFRDSFIIMKEGNKKYNKSKYLYIFIMIYIITGIFTYKNIWSLFPLVAAIIYLISIWNGDQKAIKQIALLCYFLWLTYNIFVFSISGIVSNIISIISTGIAVYNQNNEIKQFIKFNDNN